MPHDGKPVVSRGEATMSVPDEAERQQLHEHLSYITTAWTMLRQAHGGEEGPSAAAQEQIFRRYSPAIYRYLLGAVRDRDVADELFQEFALRFVRGAFRGANSERGRFRAFLKTALSHLVIDYRRRWRLPAVPLADAGVEPAAEVQPAHETDEEFTTIWRGEVMARAWEALADVERDTGQPLHALLRYRTDHPDARSEGMAAHFSVQLGKPVTAGWVRKRLVAARAKFTDCLVDEVTRSLDEPNAETVAEELAELHVLEFCKDALARRFGTP